jgi:hypothetical protein
MTQTNAQPTRDTFSPVILMAELTKNDGLLSFRTNFHLAKLATELQPILQTRQHE